MKLNRVTTTLAFVATLFAGSTAFAAGPTNAEYFPFQETASWPTAKTSGAAATMSTSTDARTMGAQGTATHDDRSAEILMYLKAGG